MNTEEDEFRRIELEAKRRAARDEDENDDWSEWVCPDPKGYLMKCCDCGLVHEAEFGVVRYKSETEREDCDRVDDPNLQAVFRMRRSEQWSPEDTAHRAGGMPMAQPEQEPPPEWPLIKNILAEYGLDAISFVAEFKAAQRPWQGLTDEEFDTAINSNITITDSRLLEAVYAVALDIAALLKERNHD